MQQQDATPAEPSSHRKLQIANRKSLDDLLRAVFLACSWTWVIGMFLPVLLVREYGVWAWVIFAVPNCIGAAAMGWTIRTAAQSRELVAAHRAACGAFSLVTIAFHVFFFCWLIVPWMSIGGWMPGLFMFAFAYLTMRSSGVGFAAVLTYLYSLICAALMLSQSGIEVVATDPSPAAARMVAVAALVPVCVLGFALNPYLDLTFHAARQASSTPRSARLAFGTGFGVLFLAMILFTLAYSGLLWGEIMTGAVSEAPPSSRSAVWFVLGHILFQAAFTSGIHAASVTAGPRSGSGWLGMAVAIAVGIAAARWAQGAVYLGEMLAGELVYRLFMAFYGLVFPAYAWLCMLPTWRNPSRPTRRALAACGAAVLLAAPFYWIAFIHQRMGWAVFGIAIVLLGRFALAGRPRAMDKA